MRAHRRVIGDRTDHVAVGAAADLRLLGVGFGRAHVPRRHRTGRHDRCSPDGLQSPHRGSLQRSAVRAAAVERSLVGCIRRHLGAHGAGHHHRFDHFRVRDAHRGGRRRLHLCPDPRRRLSVIDVGRTVDRLRRYGPADLRRDDDHRRVDGHELAHRIRSGAAKPRGGSPDDHGQQVGLSRPGRDLLPRFGDHPRADSGDGHPHPDPHPARRSLPDRPRPFRPDRRLRAVDRHRYAARRGRLVHRDAAIGRAVRAHLHRRLAAARTARRGARRDHLHPLTC